MPRSAVSVLKMPKQWGWTWWTKQVPKQTVCCSLMIATERAWTSRGAAGETTGFEPVGTLSGLGKTEEFGRGFGIVIRGTWSGRGF